MPEKDNRSNKATESQDQRTKRIRKVHSYTKYSGLAYQIFGLLAVTVFLGLKADAHFGNKTQYITAISCLVVLVAFFYKLTKTVK